MPIFEYTCTKCGQKFETLVLGNTEIQCPSCGSTKLKKQFSTFAVHHAPTRSSQTEPPCCSSSCGNGFEQGACGSGMCCGG
ncbi:MAG: zinc ribbon domain-containing protein [Spirochaetes bacterium]|nr:zinc ribbon domain-containing protein [Spirochaetota bacterium]